MKRYIRSASSDEGRDRSEFVVDFKIPDDPEYIKREERKRIQRELDDEADAYDLEHGEGIYSDD